MIDLEKILYNINNFFYFMKKLTYELFIKKNIKSLNFIYLITDLNPTYALPLRTVGFVAPLD